MEVFQASRLSKHRKIVEEIKGVTRGQMYEVTEEDPPGENKSRVRSKRARGIEGCPDYALRIYEANSTLETYGINPGLLKQTQALTLRHPNILKLLDVDMVYTCNNFQRDECQETHLLLLVELASGNVGHWMEQHRAHAKPRELVTIMNEVLQGLSYLHRHDYVHRRLHPSNVMMKENCTRKRAGRHHHDYVAKLGDFHDIAVFYRVPRDQPFPVTKDQAPYTSPEILMGYEYFLPPSDMWAFGVLMFELVFGLGITPFYDRDTQKEGGNGWLSRLGQTLGFSRQERDEVVDNIFTWLGTPTKEWRQTYMHDERTDRQALPGRTVKEVVLQGLGSDPTKYGFNTDGEKKMFGQIVDLIDLCLRVDPEKRITALHALKHPLFRSFKLIKGDHVALPRVPKVPRGTFSELRRDILRNTSRDIEAGFMQFYPSLMAVYLFDRSHGFFAQDIFEDSDDGSINSELVYGLFCSCYLIALKLMTDVPEPTPDLFKKLRGIVCGATEKNRLTILFMERTIVSRLRFRFFAEAVADIPLDLTLFKTLEKKAFRPS